MATNNDTRLGVDEDEEAILRFWDVQVLKAVGATAIGKAIAARTNPENGFAARGKV
jgi:hypothetical protein